MISPAGICGRTAAARVCAVDHIVVDQRGAVEQFDDRGEFDRAAPAYLVARCVAVAQQQEGRPEALPAPAEQVACDF